MGLDIMALRQATYMDPQPSEDEADENYETIHRAWINSDFPQRADGLASGCYTAAEVLNFRAGSYSGYNTWREWLSKMALGVAPEVIWETGEDGPFVELIHFSDAEGIIGPVTSAKLAVDFATYAEMTHAVENGYYVETYDRFRRAFEMAADGGLVQFH